jgi:hypothetical protein
MKNGEVIFLLQVIPPADWYLLLMDAIVFIHSMEWSKERNNMHPWQSESTNQSTAKASEDTYIQYPSFGEVRALMSLS